MPASQGLFNRAWTDKKQTTAISLVLALQRREQDTGLELLLLRACTMFQGEAPSGNIQLLQDFLRPKGCKPKLHNDFLLRQPVGLAET